MNAQKRSKYKKFSQRIRRSLIALLYFNKFLMSEGRFVSFHRSRILLMYSMFHLNDNVGGRVRDDDDDDCSRKTKMKKEKFVKDIKKVCFLESLRRRLLLSFFMTRSIFLDIFLLTLSEDWEAALGGFHHTVVTRKARSEKKWLRMILG